MSVFSQVIGKFSIRIVPDQTPELVEKLTVQYLEKRWSQRKTPNRMRTWCDGDRGWLGDTNHINFQAGIRSQAHICLVCDILLQCPRDDHLLDVFVMLPSMSEPPRWCTEWSPT